MRTPIVAANWKMHGRQAMLGDFVAGLRRIEAGDGVDMVLCPPFPYLATLAKHLAGVHGVALGAQDCSPESGDGAFTGEVSAAMLADVGCRWVIVGHSERRRRAGESDDQVAAKFAAAGEAGLTPILCVGESGEERAVGRAEAVVRAQLEAVIGRVGADRLGLAALAYEPVWAIGSGQPASAETAQDMHRVLRDAVARRSGAAARTLRILYGGSVKADNAAAFFEQADIDGALVGGASLDPAAFCAIAVAAAAAGSV